MPERMNTEPRWNAGSGIRVAYSPELLAEQLRPIRGQRRLFGNPSQSERIQARGEPVQAGALDGITILRYAHIIRGRSSGGVEQYIRQLDRHLLRRHRMNIVQMHLVDGDLANPVEVENVGLGRIFWTPVPVRRGAPGLRDLSERVYRCCKSLLPQSRQPAWAWLRHSWVVLSGSLAGLLRTQTVDLLALHWSTYDTGAVIKAALRAGVPFVFINHFDNHRLALRDTRKHIAHAARIGTVSGCGIPEDLRSRCSNLSDAVDTEFFDPEAAAPADLPGGHVLFLPGRIGEGKGHRDLLQAGRILITKKIDIAICFAGAVESNSLDHDLREANVQGPLQNRVFLPGELTPEEIRSCYARSSVVALPTDSEGLPRVLLEAQAMKIPIVTYRCGGTTEALMANITGFLVEKGDIAGMADRIEFLLKNPPARSAMGERGREHVTRQFAIPALIQRHEEFYLEAIRQSVLGSHRSSVAGSGLGRSDVAS